MSGASGGGGGSRLAALPDEILAHCFSYATTQTLGRLAACNRALRRFAYMDQLWRPKLLSAVAVRGAGRRERATTVPYTRCRGALRNLLLLEARDKRWKEIRVGERAREGGATD